MGLIWPFGHIYGSRLGIANKFALLWGFCDIWPFGHIYGSRLGIANKFALLSASAIFGLSATYTVHASA